MRLPFDSTRSAVAQGKLRRLLRMADTSCAETAIERALAAAGSNPPNASVVQQILSSHHVGAQGARALTMGLWARALAAFVDDDVITDAEQEYLIALRNSFGLAERETNALQHDLTSRILRDVAEEALTDNTLNDDEWRQIEVVASGLRLPPHIRAAIMEEPIAAALARAFSEVIADHRVSPAEEKRMHELAASLGVDPNSFDINTRQLLEKLSLLWRIENEELPQVPAPISLQRSEVCHGCFNVIWHELRTRTTGVRYAGPVASIPIMKGLRYRIGSVRTGRVSVEELTRVDEGTIYVTNKRLIFDGAKRNTSIRYSAILSIEPFSDGLRIEKASGRSPTLVVLGDADVANALLAEVLHRST